MRMITVVLIAPTSSLWDGRIKKACIFKDKCTINIAEQYRQPVIVITESWNKTWQTLLRYLFQSTQPNTSWGLKTGSLKLTIHPEYIFFP